MSMLEFSYYLDFEHETYDTKSRPCAHAEITCTCITCLLDSLQSTQGVSSTISLKKTLVINCIQIMRVRRDFLYVTNIPLTAITLVTVSGHKYNECA